jgi:hypothetical protein
MVVSVSSKDACVGSSGYTLLRGRRPRVAGLGGGKTDSHKETKQKTTYSFLRTNINDHDMQNILSQ